MIALVFWAALGLITYAYAGYPLALAAAGPLVRRLRPRPAAASTDRPPYRTPQAERSGLVSCVVPALDEADRIEAKLHNLFAELDGMPAEVIVVDDGSTDDTARRVLAVDDDRVTLVRHPVRRGKPSALNSGVAAAGGDTLVFSDADVVLTPGSLRAMLSTLSEPEVGIVGAGRSVIGDDDGLAEAEGLYWRYEQFIQRQESELGACVAMSGAVLALERDSFEPLPTDVINDDFYLAMQALRRGKRAVHEPRATAVVGLAADAAAERRRRERIVAGRWQAMARADRFLPWRRAVVLWEVASHKLLRPIVPLAFLGSLAASLAAAVLPRSSGGLLALRGRWRFLALAAHLGFLLLAALGERSERRGSSHRLLAVPLFLVSSNRAALRGFVGFVTGSQSARWRRAPSPHQLRQPERTP